MFEVLISNAGIITSGVVDGTESCTWCSRPIGFLGMFIFSEDAGMKDLATIVDVSKDGWEFQDEGGRLEDE